SGANRVANNLIHHTPYSGITVSTRTAWAPANTTADGSRTVRWAEVGDAAASVDWHARERFLHARQNRIERNDIHHIMERLGDCQADHNLYFCAEDPAWGRKHLEHEQPLGVEAHSIAADPLFVSWETGDYRLKPESPAFALGFRPINPSEIGLLPGHPFRQE